MRLDDFDCIVCDIDDTLIRGWMVDFMDYTWKTFKSIKLANILAYLEYKFKLYEVNNEVFDLLDEAIQRDIPVIFMTARSYTTATRDMLRVINSEFTEVYQLASLDAPKDKRRMIRILKNGVMDIHRILLVDDNIHTRHTCIEDCLATISPEGVYRIKL